MTFLITEDRLPFNSRRRDTVGRQNSRGTVVQRKLSDSGSRLRPPDVDEWWARLRSRPSGPQSSRPEGA